MFKTVAAEYLTNSSEQSEISHACRALSQETDESRLIGRITEHVQKIAPMRVAILIFGRTLRTLSSDDFPAERLKQLRSRIETCPNLIQEVSRNATPLPRWFSDGSVQFLLPLIHEGVCEGLVCLHGIDADCEPPSEEQLRSLEPLWGAAACAVAGIFEERAAKHTGERMGFATRDVPHALSSVASRLLGNIAHDIRSPATVVRGYIRMLLDGRAGPLTGAQQDCVEFALSAATKLGALGATVEEAAQSMATLSAEDLDLRDLWSKACQSRRHQALAQAITIHENIPAQRVPVSGDRAAITALLEQLFAQALEKAMRNGDMRVAISDEVGGATLKLSVPLGAAMERLEASEPGTLFSDLRNRFFIHGGTLLCWLKQGEYATVTISLPGGTE